jgi:hypothetical protein
LFQRLSAIGSGGQTNKTVFAIILPLKNIHNYRVDLPQTVGQAMIGNSLWQEDSFVVLLSK